ncbi:MAG: cadmium resistance transporter [Betaproteobacteria bacterium]|nr:cadmium resistance transporter [Betaproteobacteria bacterium]
MTSLVSTLGIGTVVFSATNVDDLLVVAAFFADPRLRQRFVVIGQFLGIGALVLASALAALLALAIPQGWVAFSGLIPLYLGLHRLFTLRRVKLGGAADISAHREREHLSAYRSLSQILAVAAVTVANGGDNLGVYIPLFAAEPYAIPAYALIFGVMTALWCALAHVLVGHRILGESIRRYGHLALPFVLIALGFHILLGALILVR